MDSLGKQSYINFKKINSVINKEALILITNVEGEIVYLNKKCGASLGYKTRELIGKHTRIFKTGLHSSEFYRAIWSTLLAGEVWKGEISARRKDGSVEWYFMSIFPMLDDKHTPYQFLTLRTDITDLKEMENQALIREKQLSSFAGILKKSVVGVIDANGKILFLSPAVEGILGYSERERVGGSIFDHIEPVDISRLKRLIEDLKNDQKSFASIEVRIENKSGHYRFVEFVFENYLNDPILHSIFFTYHDITEQIEINQQMEKMLYCDEVTGLPNYRSFEEHLSVEIEHAKENGANLAIIQLGLDDFKFVNNSLGHPAGDQLLRKFSNRMKDNLTENMTIYRIGGDVFTMLIKGILDVEALPEILSRLISLVNKEPFHIDGNSIYVSVSLGASIFPYSGVNKDELLKNAEVAMYQAKNSGKNQYQIFSSTMNLFSYKQFHLRNDSKHALQRNEFLVYYQPRVNPLLNEVVSGEALIRWIHPKWGMVMPDEFISMAEESGLIVSIGEWIIKRVCLELKKWEAENISIKISINLSAIQLLQPQFVKKVSLILEETNVDPKWIEFEITETVIIEKEEQVLKTINQLKELGITIALDDFGTGYSSLNYLKKFPCDVIKLDKSLIRDIHKDQDDYDIIAAIISLCHKLNKTVVAEGVETQEQLTMLKRLQCDEIQGYLYSKPVNEHEFKNLLINGISLKGENSGITPIKDKRKFFRVSLNEPLIADLTIKKVMSKKINIGSNSVYIHNIGPRGLCFSSPLKLSVTKKITLQFKIEILSKPLTLKGNIVWYKEIESNYYQYGVEFNFIDGGQEQFIKLLEEYQEKITR